jgi:hypothetical protein
MTALSPHRRSKEVALHSAAARNTEIEAPRSMRGASFGKKIELQTLPEGKYQHLVIVIGGAFDVATIRSRGARHISLARPEKTSRSRKRDVRPDSKDRRPTLLCPASSPTRLRLFRFRS